MNPNKQNYRVNREEGHTNITMRLMKNGTRIKIQSQDHKFCIKEASQVRFQLVGPAASFNFRTPGPMNLSTRQRWEEVEHEQCVH